MTLHQPPDLREKPLHRWGSVEIAAFFSRAPRTGPLPEPGMNAMPLLIEPWPVMTETPPDTRLDWTGTMTCNHRRDAGMPRGAPAIRAADLSSNQRRILKILAGLDTRLMPNGQPVRMCVNRRRLKASAEAMNDLYRAGLVNGAGSRDPWGTGNTADSSWWWLSTAGVIVARDLEGMNALDF